MAGLVALAYLLINVSDISQSAPPLWTVWCQRSSSAFSWRPLATIRCFLPMAKEGSASSSAKPSASRWLLRASGDSWGSSWSPRCLLDSSRIGRWGSVGPKVNHAWSIKENGFHEKHGVLLASGSYKCNLKPTPSIMIHYLCGSFWDGWRQLLCWESDLYCHLLVTKNNAFDRSVTCF